MKDKEPTLFNIEDLEKWKTEWIGMPEFVQEDLDPVQQIMVSFETREDVEKFAELTKQKLTYKTKSIWYPESSKEKPSNFIYIDES